MSETLALPWWRRVRTTPLVDLVRGRISGRLDWRAEIAAAALPAECAAVITETVRRTRLWRREKVEVGSELISHFQEGLSSGRTAADLANDFGEPAVAARLIRRSKIRCRPWHWHVQRWIVWGLVALLALYGVFWLRVWRGRPTIAVDYVARANERFVAQAETAAWDDYSSAIHAMNAWRTAQGQDELSVHALAVRPDEDSWPETLELLEANQTALAELRAASLKAHLGVAAGVADVEIPDEARADGGPPFVVYLSLSYLQPMRVGAHVLAADARRAAIAGESDVAMQDIEAILAAGELINESPFLLSGIYAVIDVETALDAIDWIVVEHRDLFSKRQLQALAHRVAAYQGDWDWWLASERFASRDFIQRLYTDDGRGNGIITLKGLQLLDELMEPMNMLAGVTGSGGSTRSARSLGDSVREAFHDAATSTALLPAVLADRQDMQRMSERLYDYELRNWSQPLYETAPSKSGPETVDPLLEINRWSATQRLRYLPVAIIMPAFQAARAQVERFEGRREGVLAGLALELARRANGEWPDDLASLSPRWLPNLPVDRLTGEPLHYRIHGDRPVVYSVGTDLDDDGGRWPRDSDDKSVGQVNLSGFHGQASEDAQDDGDWIVWGAEASP